MDSVNPIETADIDTAQSDEGVSKRSWKQAIVREVRTHLFGYVVLGLSVLAGPLLAPLLFPQAPPSVAVVGGLAFGLYAALCAVPQKFM